MPNVRNGAARPQAVDLTRIKAEFLQDLVRVLPQTWSNPRRDFGGFFHRHWTVHGIFRIAGAIIDWDDDLICQKLRVFDDLFRDLHNSIRNARSIKHILPISKRLCSKETIEFNDERSRIGVTTPRISEPRVSQ